MMGFLLNLFGLGSAAKEVSAALANGAAIVDVRSASEFSGAHVKGSVNIPLQKIPDQLDKIKAMPGPVVLCCASGMRSKQASDFLRNKGVNCINGGGWSQVQKCLPAQ